MNQREWRAFELRKADEAVLDRAAAWLRHDAIQQQFAGFQHQERAFAVASLLDELARHLNDIDESVRRQAVATAHNLVGDRPGDPRGRRARQH